MTHSSATMAMVDLVITSRHQTNVLRVSVNSLESKGSLVTFFSCPKMCLTKSTNAKEILLAQLSQEQI